jgi:Na+/phosphate symporter
LTFQLDRDSDRMREMLQKVREKTLVEGTRKKRTTAAASEARRTGTDLYDLLGRLRATGLSQAQNDIVAELTDVCDELLMSIERVARSSQAPV